ETLPAAELTAILEVEGFDFEVKEKLDQVVRLDAAQNSVQAVQHRSAYARICALELFTCPAQETDITKTADSTSFKNVLSEGESFAVRIRRVREYAEKVSTVALERTLGKHILLGTSETRVNLKAPDKTFIGVLTSDKLVFGVKLAEIIPKPFVERRPRKKPFFHPSAMPSKLARCMVNLAHAKAGELVLDPFCGTGSVMVEAAFIGCRVLGFDIQRRMVKGCRNNLEHFSVEPDGLVIADARKLPLTQIDCLATDPPYGRSATTMKLTTKQIVEGVLGSARSLLRQGQRICIASPKTLNIARIGVELGYRHLESHFAYVHRSLTREIAVFEIM
ncbi:MAG: methyltransferase domain-containing protein, partial [Candidatus Bathyarchaeota archaeon]